MAQRVPAASSVSAKPRAVRARVQVPEEVRKRMVAEAAYYIAESRGFAQSDAKADWLAAEAEIEELLTDTQVPG